MTIISLIESEIKDPTYTSISASYLDLHLEIDSENLNTITLTLVKEIIIGITSSGISDQLREMYSICRCCRNVVTYKWFIMGKS
jgi:predicted RNase H-related nuclease YkuK (DUF458 family)